MQPVQERFFSHLDWITEFYLIPICSQFEKREQLEQTLLHATKKLAQVVGHTNSLAHKLNAFTEKTGEVVKLFERVTNKDSSFYQASTRLSDAVEEMGGNYGQLTNRIDELVTEHNKSVSRYETYIIRLQETQEGFTHSQEQLVEGFTHSQKQLVEGISKIPEEFQTVVDDYAKILQGNHRYLNKLDKLIESLETQQIDYTAHVKDAADSMTASLKGVNETTATLEGFTIAFNKQAQSLIPELTKLGVDPLLHQYVEELKNSLIRTQNEFMASIQQQQETMQEEFNKMDSLKQIEQSVKEMHHLLKERQKSWFSSLFKKG